MKKLIVFDLDGTLTASKSAVDPEMSGLLHDLLAIVKVAVISGGGWPQFEKQLVSNLPHDKLLANLSLLPTCGTKFYRYESADWKKIYSEDFTTDQREKILDSLTKAIGAADFKIEKLWGKQIEDRGSQITFSALGQQAPLEEKEQWDPDRRAAHDRRRRRRRRRSGRREPAQADARAASCAASARRRSTSTASTSRRTPRSSGASRPCSSASRAFPIRSRSCAASRSASPAHHGVGIRDAALVAAAVASPTATSPTASCRTRRSTSSTKPRRASRWRSSRHRSTSTRRTAAFAMQLEIELAAMSGESDEIREPVERALAEAKEERDGRRCRSRRRRRRRSSGWKGRDAAHRRAAAGSRTRRARREPAAGRRDPLRRAAGARARARVPRRLGRRADGEGRGRRGRRRHRRRAGGRAFLSTGCSRARPRSSSTWRSACTSA